MNIETVAEKAREFIRQRCREHLGIVGSMRGAALAFDYRYEHTRTVAAIAGSLADEVGVDPALARIAAWLHDIAKCWRSDLDEGANRERGENHGSVGAEEAAVFLESLGLPPEPARQIHQAIANHVGYLKDYPLAEPLDALLWDADKLSKIGVAGSLHLLGARLTLKNEFTDLAQYFSQPDLELHRGIRDSLNTEAARRWADREMAAAAEFRRQAAHALAGGTLQG